MTPPLPRLVIGPLLPEERTVGWTTCGERCAAAAMSARRRSEYLTWRTLVRRELGRSVVIGYDTSGAPRIEGGPCLSVTHCADRVAVCLAERPCAVDIEPETRCFGRVLPRYLTDRERRLWAHPLWPAAAWCAKEALYKYAGREGLDWLRDLRLEDVEVVEDVEEGAEPACEANRRTVDEVGKRVFSTSPGQPGTNDPAEGVRSVATGNDFVEGLPEAYRPFATIAGRIEERERVSVGIFRGEGYILACIV